MKYKWARYFLWDNIHKKRRKTFDRKNHMIKLFINEINNSKKRKKIAFEILEWTYYQVDLAHPLLFRSMQWKKVRACKYRNAHAVSFIRLFGSCYSNGAEYRLVDLYLICDYTFTKTMSWKLQFSAKKCWRVTQSRFFNKLTTVLSLFVACY